MDIEPGTVVASRYRISRPLGRGGMGEVFAAVNVRTGRPVAIKLLRSDTKAKSSAVKRFRQEALAAGQINSDHVTEVLDVEEDDEHGVVIVFELLEGESLIDRLKRTGPIPFEELHPIIDQVWMGLVDAHRVGIIHRDLKPSNVFLERRPDGTTRVKILDFGISKLPKEIGGETLTEMGQSLGTFSFMPPEQIGSAKMVDHRADIYACTTLVYQSLSGQLPYLARNILVMVELKKNSDARTLSEAMGAPVDPRLEAFITKGLARDANKRFQTAVEALAAWRDLRPPPRSGAQGPGSSGPRTASASPRLATQPEPAPQRSLTPGQRPAVGEPHRMSTASRPTPELDADTAATVSMPAPHFAELSTPEPPPRIEPRMNAAISSPRPMNLGGTQLLAPDSQIPLPLVSPRAQSSPGRTTGVALAPAQPQPLASPAAPPPSGQPSLPRVFDDPTSIPSSSGEGATQVYRPRANDAPPARVEPAPLQPPPPKQSSPWAFLLGAIAFLLVGFLIVAALMRYRYMLPGQR